MCVCVCVYVFVYAYMYIFFLVLFYINFTSRIYKWACKFRSAMIQELIRHHISHFKSIFHVPELKSITVVSPRGRCFRCGRFTENGVHFLVHKPSSRGSMMFPVRDERKYQLKYAIRKDL